MSLNTITIMGMSRVLGYQAEEIASNFLRKKGFKILARNFRTKIGEIDIIALKEKRKFFFFKKQSLHFVEVKSGRESFYFFPEFKVNSRKRKKIAQVAEIWLSQNKKLKTLPIQIDVLSLIFDKEQKLKEITYFENVAL